MTGDAEKFVALMVEPFEGNAEAKVQADHEVRALLAVSQPDQPLLNAAADRIEHAQRSKLSRFWRPALYTISTVVSLAIAAAAVRYWLAKGSIGSELMPKIPPFLATSAHPAPSARLTPEQRFLLFGDLRRSSVSEQRKALWEAHPDSVAYFAGYSIAYAEERNAPPADFLDFAKEHDPENGWFPAFASAQLAVQAVKQISRPHGVRKEDWAGSWDILDPKKLDDAWSLLIESASKTSFRSYEKELANQRIPLFPKERGNVERLERLYFDISAHTSSLKFRYLSDIAGAKAQQAVAANDPARLKVVLTDWDRFCTLYLKSEERSVIDTIVMLTVLRTSTNRLAHSAEKLGLTAEASRLSMLKEKFERWKDQTNAADDAKAPGDRYSTLDSLILYTASHQPDLPMDPAQLDAGRYSDHEFLQAKLATWALPVAGLLIIAVALYRFRGGRLFSTLSRRVVLLFTPADWSWLLIGGTIAPLVAYEWLSRTAFLGGRAHSLGRSSSGLDAPLNLGPLEAFVVALCTLMFLPPIIARWRLSRRASFLGIAWKRNWVDEFGIYLLIAAWIFNQSFRPEDGSEKWPWIPFLSIATAALALAMFHAGRALFSSRKNLLKRLTLSRVILPSYALGLLLMALTVPLSRTLECSWLRQDHLTEVREGESGIAHADYLAVENMRTHLSDLWNSVPPVK